MLKSRLPSTSTSTTRVLSSKPINDENMGIGNGAKRVASRSTAPLQNITNLSKDQTKKPVLKPLGTSTTSTLGAKTSQTSVAASATAGNRVRVFGKPVTQSNALKPKGVKPLATTSAIAAPRQSEQHSLITPMSIGFGEDIMDKENVEPMLIDEMEEDFFEEAEDIDYADKDDPQCVTEYVNQIYEYLREKEMRDAVLPSFITNQIDVNEKMRGILIDWLAEVHLKFNLLPETFFLACNILDHYLSVAQVARSQLQLVGVTSMLIASKYEEIYPPEVNDYVFVTDNTYTRDEILEKEGEILNTLNFNLTYPSMLHFLRRFSKAGQSDYVTHTLCKYLIELSTLDVKMYKYLPSQIAAAAVYLSRKMAGLPCWSPTLQKYSTYTEEGIKGCAVALNDLLKKMQSSTLQSIIRKYSHKKFGCVAQVELIDL
jgi:hypothetical protein